MVRTSLTLGGLTGRRLASLVTGVGMIAASALTIQHYFAANFPESIWEGSFCDLTAFFNCDSSAFAPIAALAGVPLGLFGMMVGALVTLGTVFPSPSLERTNKSIAALNALGVVGLLVYSVLALGSLCLLCAAYYLFALVSFGLFWRYGIDRDAPSLFERYGRPSPTHLAVFGVVTLAAAYGFARFHDAKEDARSGGVAARLVEQFYSLPTVPTPSFVSPFWTAQATERFEDAPIRVIEYGDLLCSDCLYLDRQFARLKEEFAGKMNVVFQFFPLEAACNDVVEKDKHPGACEISYLAAYDSAKFLAIHDEIFDHFQAAKTPEWRRDLARRHGVEAAFRDSATHALVHRIIRTGTEYEQTHELYSHGIRSTPTMIINNRMIIGTFPYEQLRAIFQALVDEHEAAGRRFLENWVDS